MSKFGGIRVIEQKVRSSMSYSRWVTRNKAPSCLCCGRKTDLECHHVISLYQIISGWWKYYEDEQATLNHVLAMHDNDNCENITLCSECHAKKHPLRSPRQQKGGAMRADNWMAYPRLLNVPFSQSTQRQTNSSLGLVGFQTLLAMGWYVLNGYMDSKMIEVSRISLARMLGKDPGTSFNKSLDEALKSLSRLGFLNAYHLRGNRLELHLSPNYIDELAGNPWFISSGDVKTSNMCTLTLRWFLGTQSNRRFYKIGLDKLKVHLGMTVKDKWQSVQALKKACLEIKWAKLKMEKDMCVFKIARRGATPINSLRSVLQDSINHGT